MSESNKAKRGMTPEDLAALINDAERYRFLRDAENWGADECPNSWEDLAEATMSDFDDIVFKEKENIHGVVLELRGLSRALFTVGNSVLGETLLDISLFLEDSNKNIDRAVSDNIRSECKKAQQATGNMLRACLAVGGSDLGETE